MTTIRRMNTIAEMIVSSISQQGAATQEIARSVQEAALETREVSGNIVGSARPRWSPVRRPHRCSRLQSSSNGRPLACAPRSTPACGTWRHDVEFLKRSRLRYEEYCGCHLVKRRVRALDGAHRVRRAPRGRRILVLRHQLNVFHRRSPKRVPLRNVDLRCERGSTSSETSWPGACEGIAHSFHPHDRANFDGC